MGEMAPIRGAHLQGLAFAGAELEHLGHRLAVGLEAGLGLPDVEELGGQSVEHGFDRALLLLRLRGDRFLHLCREACAVEPGARGLVLFVGDRVQQKAVELARAEVVAALHERQERCLGAGQVHVGGAEQEGLVAFVPAAVD